MFELKARTAAGCLKKEADGKPAKYPPQPTPTSFATLSGLSKKQTAVSHSTPEAEIVAADTAIRGEGIPLLDFMDKMLSRPVTMHFYEDNEAAELIIKSGRNPALRHVGRTHKVDMDWLHELHENKTFVLHGCPTQYMKADIHTKAFPDAKLEDWASLLKQMGIVAPGKQWRNAMNKTEEVAKTKKKAAAAKESEFKPRLIIEFCCGTNRKLGQVELYKEAKNCKVERITLEHDATSKKGRDHILNQVKECDGPNTLLFSSMPCMGEPHGQAFTI
jgi:hypothetical protein